MKTVTAVYVGVLCLACAAALSLEDFLGSEPLTRERVVRDMIEYYKRDEPVGIPVLQVPEPLFIDANVSAAVIDLHGLNISGHSKFKLQYVNVNATKLTATVLLRIPVLQVLSVYVYGGFFGSTIDNANLTLVGLDITVDAELGSNFNSMLQLVNFKISVDKEEFIMALDNAPLSANVVFSAADTLFGTLVGNVVNSRTQTITEKINERLSQRFPDKRFPVGISPVDLLVAGVKQDLRHKVDPLLVGSKVVNLPAGITLNVSSIIVSGLSTVHRHGEVSLQLIDDRLLLVMQLGTQAISVQADLEISLPVLPSITSTVQLTLDSFSVWVEIQQSADVRHPPQLRRIHITLGNFRLLSSGESTLSYLLEAAVSGLPNALRGPICQAVEPILHKRIQQRLYTLDIEEIIEKRLAAAAAAAVEAEGEA